MQKTFIRLFIGWALFESCSKDPVTVPPPPTIVDQVFYKGADLSFSPEIDASGTVFSDSITTGGALTILKNHGANLIRLRLWHSPADSHSSLPEVLNFAQQIKSAGLSFLLDIHYSDTWADQGQQSPPAAWASLDFSQLEDSIYQYSKNVLSAFRDQNTLPDIVQIGNEVNIGFLWDEGKVNWSDESTWMNFSLLVNKAIAGIKSVDTENKIRIMVHYAGLNGSKDFFKHLEKENIDYDIIGLSYYPFWHGTDLNTAQNQLNEISDSVRKDIMIVETAYPWTFQWNDYTNNIIGQGIPLIPGYPASPTGQEQFLEKLSEMLHAVNDKHGIGFCYWAPDWVAYNGPQSTEGSSWENLTLFDFSNKALQAVNAFGK